MTQPKRLPLHDRHLSARARFIEFAGWQMPVQYEGILAEHAVVRRAAGLFDVSHMGVLSARGSRAGEFLQKLTMNDIRFLMDGKAQYTALLTPQGTILDDLIVYRVHKEDYRLVVNASRTARDLEWLREQAGQSIEVIDQSGETVLLALQGPAAAGILERLSQTPARLRPFRHAGCTIAGVDVRVARTGYTGEDGFELLLPVQAAARVWDALLEAGQREGLRPVGLGARETLRLEAGLMLYGQDIDETTSPLEAGLGRFLALDKGDFIGREALERQRDSGLTRRLAAFEMAGAGVPRPGYDVWAENVRVGTVTSGGVAPTLRKNVGMAYVPVSCRESPLEIEIRGRRVAARLTHLPFYRRGNNTAR